MSLQDLDKSYIMAMVSAMYDWSSRISDLQTERDDFDLYAAWLGAGCYPVTTHYGRQP